MFETLLENRKACLLLAAVLLLLGLEGLSHFRVLPHPLALACLAAALVLARGVWWSGLKALAGLRFASIPLLITLAAGGAAALGEFLEAAVVLSLYALGESLEEFGFRRSYAALEALLQKAPQQAQVKGEAGPRSVDSVEAGQVVEVRAGEALPVDGEVLWGSAQLDEASVTGESFPVMRGPGDRVFAGTLNVEGYLELRATRAGRDSTLARTVALTYEAGERKIRLQGFMERFARVYTPVIFLMALAVLGLGWALGQPLRPWLERALSLLVIACPCALVMATPVAVFAAVSCASRRGAVVKGGRAVEALARVRVAAFDKTRNLTQGLARVERVVPFRGQNPNQVLAAAAGLELCSRHPLAQGILEAAQGAGAQPHPMEGFESHAGRGVSGRCVICDDNHHCLGSPDFAEAQHGLEPEVRAQVEGLQRQGFTVAVLSDGEGSLGLLALEDALRPEAAPTVAALRRLGVASVLLTGDHAASAAAAARATGIADYRADLLPEGKQAAVQELQASRGPVAMVGDGVNDAPALACAAVGLAMGAAGSDAAVENADVALMNSNLALLPFLIRLSRRCVATLRFNIALALGVKAAVLAMALAAWVGIEAAILADVGLTVLVILNSLRLLAFEQE